MSAPRAATDRRPADARNRTTLKKNSAMDFDLLSTLLIVCPLIFLGGLVDAIAGGGGLITLPAYLIAGVPAHLALGTNKLSNGIGTMVSTFRLWRAGFLDVRSAMPAVACAFLGSAAGARIALLVPEETFRLILIVMLPVAAFFVFRKSAIPPEGEAMESRRRLMIVCIASLVCGAYDGFYGPGAGTFMLISYTLFARMGVREASGQMKAVNLSSNVAAFVMFATSGEVWWLVGLIAAVFSIAGHYVGSGLVLKNGTQIVKPIIAVVLAILFAKTAWELLG